MKDNKHIKNFIKFNETNKPEFILDTDDLVFYYKGVINDTREYFENDEEYNWKEDPYVEDAIEELEKIGYYYDEESWDVFPNEDEQDFIDE